MSANFISLLLNNYYSYNIVSDLIFFLVKNRVM